MGCAELHWRCFSFENRRGHDEPLEIPTGELDTAMLYLFREVEELALAFDQVHEAQPRLWYNKIQER